MNVRKTVPALLLALCLLPAGGCVPADPAADGTQLPAALGPAYSQEPLTLDSPLFKAGGAEEGGLLGMCFGGVMERRMASQMDNWMYPAVCANPGMLEVFRQRDSALSLPIQAWYGEFPGKYLTSAALMYRLNHDEGLRRTGDDLVDQLAAVQDEDGYLGVFARSDRILGTVDTDINGTANHGANWDLWNHYHVIRGLLAWHRQTGSRTALDTACRAADYLCAFFQSDHSLAEVGEADKNLSIVSAWVDLYQLTGEQRYLDFLNACLAAWQSPGNGDFYRQGLAGTPFCALSQNRWEAMHGVLALARIYDLTGDDSYRTAFLNLWESLREYDRHNGGGVTNWERAVGTPYQADCVETCATAAWLELSAAALRLTGDSTVADELELTTWNALLGAQSPSGRWYTYNTPDEGVRLASSHELNFQAVPGSPELNCCALSGPAGLGLLSLWALSSDAGGVSVNYYGPCQMAVRSPAGNGLLLEQETDYPAGGTIRLTLSLDREEAFPLRLRIPAWSRETAVRVNGEACPARAGSYCTLERTWKSGDTVELELDLTPHLWPGAENRTGTFSLYRGPLLLAADERFNESLSVSALPPCRPEGLVLVPEDPSVVPSCPAPLVLLRAEFGNGQTLTLCDFATAGMAGTDYATWLPAAQALTGPNSPGDGWLTPLEER